MSTRIAINGLGRIGRAILKLVIGRPELELVAVNDLADIENLAYLRRRRPCQSHELVRQRVGLRESDGARSPVDDLR
jgi:glyceraldehyde-3-phosphate dehydrogenase/erythrose-4-phosphate dehydrogenase